MKKNSKEISSHCCKVPETTSEYFKRLETEIYKNAITKPWKGEALKFPIKFKNATRPNLNSQLDSK